MAVPKQKTSKMKTRSQRSANMRFDVRSPAYCSYCGSPKLPHRICPSCGYYKNRQVVEVKEYEA